MDSSFSVPHHKYPLKIFLPHIERLWYIGKKAKEVLFSSPEIESEMPNGAAKLQTSSCMPEGMNLNCKISDPIPLQTALSLGIPPAMNFGWRNPNIWAVIVCHAPIMIEGHRHLIGFDLLPKGPSGLFGKIDLWNVDQCLKWNFFPEPTTGRFIFVTKANALPS